MHPTRRLALALPSLLLCPAVRAAGYPDHVVRIVASAAAGSSLDLFGRAYTEAMHAAWEQPAIFDPRGGANGMVGTREVAKAAPDGYTILLTSVNHVLNPVVRLNAGYDPVADFAPVALVVKHPMVLIAPPDFEAKSLADLLALARRKPDELVYGSPGIGSVNHLAMEAVKNRADVKIRHIPYGGSPQALNGVLGGETPLYFSNLVLALPHIQAGKVRALAVTSAQRLAILPQVPTLAEGMPGLVLESWYGLVAPAGTPADVVDKVGAVIRQVTDDEEFRKKVMATGGSPEFMPPERFRPFLVAQVQQWTEVVAQAKIPRE